MGLFVIFPAEGCLAAYLLERVIKSVSSGDKAVIWRTANRLGKIKKEDYQ